MSSTLINASKRFSTIIYNILSLKYVTLKNDFFKFNNLIKPNLISIHTVFLFDYRKTITKLVYIF